MVYVNRNPIGLRPVAKGSIQKASARNIVRAIGRRKSARGKTFPHDSFQVIHHVNILVLIPIDSRPD
jgi:hypothetical protein